MHRLPSGRAVKVLGVTKMFFSKGDPALMLKYRTDLRLDDQEQLRKEVEVVWQSFRVDVEQAGLKAAIINSPEPPKRVLIVTNSGDAHAQAYCTVHASEWRRSQPKFHCIFTMGSGT